jgi:3'-5' exoribonuclease
MVYEDRPTAPTVPRRPTHPTHPTQPTQFTHPTQATHARQPALPSPATTAALPTTPALISTPALPITPALATVPALPITPALATVPALPTTPALFAAPTLPTTPLPLDTDPGSTFSTMLRRDSTSASMSRARIPSAVRTTFQFMLVNEFSDGMEVDQVLLVREVERRQRRDGGDYLRLHLGDRTGAIVSMVWEDIRGTEDLARAGAPVHVRGRYTVHPRFGPQINLHALDAAVPGSFTLEDLLDGPARGVEQMEEEVRELLDTIQEPHLRILLERVFGEDSELWSGYRVAPAAKYYHQAYRHGLLEHCLGVAQAVSAISATFGAVDRDVAVTGALLHDIGKLEAYTDDPQNIDLTDAGRLLGEIPLGYYRIRRMIEDIEGFPTELARAVGHIILSHHGALEHGSPVVPCTREATLVHMIDNLGGRLGSFDRLEKELAPGKRWSSFDRAIDGAAFFPARGEVDIESAEQAREAA